MGTAARREREKAQRRRDILDAARALFWERGYDATTMPAVAEACELAPGTLYLYFPGKGALYAELLLEGYDVLVERLRAAAGPGRPPRDEAEALIDAFLAFAEEFPHYFDIIFFVRQMRVGGEADVLPAQQRARLRAREDACKALVSAALARAVPGADAEERAATVDAVWSMLVGLVLYFRKQGPERFRAVGVRAKAVLMRAFFGAVEDADAGGAPQALGGPSGPDGDPSGR